VTFATDQAEARGLLDIRRAAFPAMQQLGPLLLEDVCVPLPRLSQTVEAVGRIAGEEGAQVAVVAHAGDGNLHPVLVMPAGSEDRTWRTADTIFRTAVEAGGTVSGEHDMGRLKARWLQQELSETALDVQRTLRASLDPLGILNPEAVLS
jgi:glycolate oxidase